jgi:uncharacterized protein (TIGR02118 family)
MHKLVILIEPPDDETEFNEMWPEFLHISECMTGLIRETTCRVESVLYGSYKPMLQHELFFDSLSDIQEAMSSPEGRATGELLQRMTGGHMSLFIADHKEDDIANIRRYQQGSADEG